MEPSKKNPSEAVAPANVTTADQDQAFRKLIDVTGGGGSSSRWRTIFLASDFALGIAAGVGAGAAAAYDGDVLAHSEIVFSTFVLLGGGLLAVVLAALAILTTFFDEKYREALRGSKGGFPAVVFPFKVVAFAGAFGAATSVVALSLWGLLSDDLRAAVFGLAAGASIWAVAGTWQLVSDTTFHGAKRAELLELDRIAALVRDRKKSA